MYLTKESLKKLVKAATIIGRVKELERNEPYMKSYDVARRKDKLVSELKELVGIETKKKEVEEETVHIRVEIPEGNGKKEKSFSLKDLLGLGKKEDTDDTELRIVQGFFPEEEFDVVRKIVKEL